MKGRGYTLEQVKQRMDSGLQSKINLQRHYIVTRIYDEIFIQKPTNNFKEGPMV